MQAECLLDDDRRYDKRLMKIKDVLKTISAETI